MRRVAWLGATAWQVAAAEPSIVEPVSNAVVRYEPVHRASRLPASFRRALARAGCRIPQPAFKGSGWTGGPENVIGGHFARQGQRDWAVVCSRRGISRIVVHWGGPARCPANADRWTDADVAGTTDAGERGYLVAIDPLSPRAIASLQPSEDLGPLARPAHDGIASVELEKGTSEILYCERGSWVTLPGMD